MPENDLNTVRNALLHCQTFSMEREFGEYRVVVSTGPASPAWPVAWLIRIQQWRPGLYSSKYCQSAEEAARYLWEVRTK